MIPTCPVHPESELRLEIGLEIETGFCMKCAKHYPLCRSVQYMDLCIQIKGHEPPHCSGDGTEWGDGKWFGMRR